MQLLNTASLAAPLNGPFPRRGQASPHDQHLWPLSHQRPHLGDSPPSFLSTPAFLSDSIFLQIPSRSHPLLPAGQVFSFKLHLVCLEQLLYNFIVNILIFFLRLQCICNRNNIFAHHSVLNKVFQHLKKCFEGLRFRKEFMSFSNWLNAAEGILCESNAKWFTVCPEVTSVFSLDVYLMFVSSWKNCKYSWEKANTKGRGHHGGRKKSIYNNSRFHGRKETQQQKHRC